MRDTAINHLPLLAKVRDYTDSAKIRAAGLYPYFRPISSAQDTEVIINGHKVLMLGSNSYLGLTNNPEIKQAVKAAVVNKRAGGMGLISGRKTFQKPVKEGVEIFHAIQDVYLTREVEVA